MKYMLLIAIVLIAVPLKAERINMCYNCQAGIWASRQHLPLPQPRIVPPTAARPVANPPRRVNP